MNLTVFNDPLTLIIWIVIGTAIGLVWVFAKVLFWLLVVAPFYKNPPTLREWIENEV